MHKILFSVIGKTDPTRNNHDGAFLHILRHYKPQKAYLFMTKEICKYQSIDNRYTEMAKRILPECEFLLLEHPEIDKPHLFDYFDCPFEEIIEGIHSDNPDSQILLNLSSGTPQMKQAAYLLLVTSKYELLGIQVDNPYFEGPQDKHVSQDYDIEDEWENLVDNDESLHPQNRCREVSTKNVRAMIIRENIISLIRTYNYSGALKELEGTEHFFDSKVKCLLNAGAKRLLLLLNEAKRYADEASYKIYPVEQINLRNILEYILMMEVKLKRGEYGDFARAISPVLFNMIIEYLKIKYKFDITKYCIKRKEVYYLTKGKMDDAMIKYFDKAFEGVGGYRESELSFNNSLIMLNYVADGKSDEGLEKFDKLRDFEKKVRNPSAHEIVGIDDLWIKKESGLTANDVLNMLKWIFKSIYKTGNSDEIWRSYDELNKEIEIYLSRLKERAEVMA